MSAFECLRAHVISLLVAGVAGTSVCLIAAVCGCPIDAIALMAVVLFVCTSVAFAASYLRERRFLDQLQRLADELDHPYQLHSLVDEPTSPDHAIVFDALRTMGVTSAREVAQANAKAREHSEFVEGWVHDVKAPLASCELVAKRVSEPERSQLASELDKISRKVNTVLWYARSDCATQDYAIREVTLADIPRKVCRDNARLLIEHDCMPQIDVDDSLRVFTDGKQAVFIVSQLVENAAKYGARHVRFSATHNDIDGGPTHVNLRVEDDGHGIPAAEVGRVFERGFTGTRGREGASSTGMGLYLAARICEQLSLGLSIASVDGEGTCATVSFPLDRRRLDVAGRSM